TGRLSRGLMDRFLVLEVDYQPRDEEIEIVLREAPGAGQRLAAFAVDLVRRTRDHPDFRYGASIRGAIDLASLLAGQASPLRGGSDPGLLRYLVCAAFTGRVRLRPAVTRSVCDLVMELFSGLVTETAGDLEVLLAEAGEGVPVPAPNETGAPPADSGPDSPGLERSGGSGEAGQSRSAPMMSRDRPVAVGPAVREMSEVADDPLADFGE